MKKLEQLKGMGINDQIDIKFGFSTYTFYRANETTIEVDCTNSGWISSKFKLSDLDKINNDVELNGFILDLDFK